MDRPQGSITIAYVVGLFGVIAAGACAAPSSSDTGDDESGTIGAASSGAITSTSVDPDSSGGGMNDTTTAPSDDAEGPGDTTMSPADSSGSAGSSSDTGEPPAVCPVTHTCIAAPPEDWTGPVNVQDVLDTGTLHPCGGGYARQIADHVTEPVGGPAQCQCSCGDVVGASCTYRVASFPLAGCAYLPDEFTPVWTALPVVNLCVDVPDSTLDWWSLQANEQGGSCSPSSSETIPDLEYDRLLRVCQGTPLADGCAADEMCAPIPTAPFNSDICIFQEGEHECPEGPYTDRTIRYTDAADTRDCSPACTCDSPEGSCTGVTATFYRDSDTCTTGGTCFNPPCTQTKTQGCSEASVSQVRAVRRTAGATYSGSCDDQGFNPAGGVTPTAPVTVCCTP